MPSDCETNKFGNKLKHIKHDFCKTYLNTMKVLQSKQKNRLKRENRWHTQIYKKWHWSHLWDVRNIFGMPPGHIRDISGTSLGHLRDNSGTNLKKFEISPKNHLFPSRKQPPFLSFLHNFVVLPFFGRFGATKRLAKCQTHWAVIFHLFCANVC